MRRKPKGPSAAYMVEQREARKRRNAARKRAKQITEDRTLRVAQAIRLGMRGLRTVRNHPWEKLEALKPKMAKRYIAAAKLAIAETNRVVSVQWKGRMTAGGKDVKTADVVSDQ